MLESEKVFWTVFLGLLFVIATGWLWITARRLAPAVRGKSSDEVFALLANQGFWWWFCVVGCFGVYYFNLGRFTPIENAAARVLLIFAVAGFSIVRLISQRGFWIFETLLLAGVAAGFYGYMISEEGFGFVNREFWLLLIVSLGTLCMAILTHGFLRALFSVIAGVMSVCSVLAYLGDGTFHDFFFWNLAVLAVGSGLMILVSRDIVHMAFWLLSSLAAVAGFYLLLGADFLGFTQVLVYIGGILILFLFGVMLTHRGDIPLKPKVSWRLLLPGILAGVAVTVLLVFLAAGNNWRELDTSEVSTLGTTTQLSKYHEPMPADPETGQAITRPVAKPTAFGLGVRFMSTYILPFEVVSILLLVAMVGATYIARGRSEGDVSGADEAPAVPEGGES